MSEARVGVVIIGKTNHRFFSVRGEAFFPGKSILFLVGAANCLAPANQNFLALPYPSDHKSKAKKTIKGNVFFVQKWEHSGNF